MTQIVQKQFDAAGAIVNLVASRVGRNRAVHPETAIAATAHLSGTMLFRSFGLDTTKIPPGVVVLSYEAGEKTPVLLDILLTVLQQCSVAVDKSKIGLAPEMPQGEPPHLTVHDTRDLLEAELLTIQREYQLSLEEAAHAGAVATAWLIRECAVRIGAEVGVNVAARGFLEGAKIAPRPPKTKPRPWYQFWK
jgi:hypothetical protein